MARPEIKNYQELKGRKIGITQYGSAAHLVLLLMLKKWNMRTDQMQILQVGSSPAMLASLDKRGIDAAVLTLPTFFVAEDRGYRIVGDPTTMDIFYLQNTLESTRGFFARTAIPPSDLCADILRESRTSKRIRTKVSMSCEKN